MITYDTRILKRYLPRNSRVIVFMCVLSTLITFSPAHAAIVDWQRGANILPRSVDDFNSDTFKQSLRNLHDTGASAVALIVPYYQSTIYSTDVAPGWNTPSDLALASAIDYAHLLGMTVTLKMHVEPRDNDWRAHINPTDRNTWFLNYSNALSHTAEIGATHNVEMIVIGTELVSMASRDMNPTNTQNWLSLIAHIRTLYRGKLTYGANSNDNSNDQFTNEKKFIGFWSALDYIGLSTYYTLNTYDNSIASLSSQWDYWNTNDLRGLSSTVGKPFIITEVGYRSIDNAHISPWDYNRSANVNMQEQSNAYEALFSYWNNYSYMQGVYLWEWSSNPDAGGAGSGDFTPQHKTAEATMGRYFKTPPPISQPPIDVSTPTFTSSVVPSPSVGTIGSPVTLTTTITNTGGVLTNAIVDIEIYDQSNAKVFQQFFENRSFTNASPQSITIRWASQSAGTYRVSVGVFESGWSKSYYWVNSASTFAVGNASTPPPIVTPPPVVTPLPVTPPSTPPQVVVTNVWWPTDGAHIGGILPFKAMLEGRDVSTYDMYWQVDGGGLVPMTDSQTDYPHKEFLVDVSGWSWQSSNNYTLTFVGKSKSNGAVIGSKDIHVIITH